jgi:anti-anti-sigma factor
MTTWAHNEPRAGVLELTGELTLGSAPQLQLVLVAHLAAHEAPEIDLLNVTAIDSAGIQLLLATRRAAERQGKALAWLGFSQAVEDALTTLGLHAEIGGPSAVVWS